MHWSMKTRIVVTLAFTSASLKRVFWNSAMDLPKAAGRWCRRRFPQRGSIAEVERIATSRRSCGNCSTN